MWGGVCVKPCLELIMSLKDSAAYLVNFLGDTRALCDDMKDFAHDYIDYGNMAKQLIPETNTVQHWSKIIETKYVFHYCASCITWLLCL